MSNKLYNIFILSFLFVSLCNSTEDKANFKLLKEKGDVISNILSFLPGNSKTLNYMVRFNSFGITEEIACDISEKFIEYFFKEPINKFNIDYKNITQDYFNKLPNTVLDQFFSTFKSQDIYQNKLSKELIKEIVLYYVPIESFHTGILTKIINSAGYNKIYKSRSVDKLHKKVNQINFATEYLKFLNKVYPKTADAICVYITNKNYSKLNNNSLPNFAFLSSKTLKFMPFIFSAWFFYAIYFNNIEKKASNIGFLSFINIYLYALAHSNTIANKYVTKMNGFLDLIKEFNENKV